MLTSRDFEVFPIIVPTKSSLRSVNFFLLKTSDSLILIDAGFNRDKYWEALQEGLQNNGFSLKDLTHIYLTHHHVDHVGLVNRIIPEHPIPIYAHPDALPRLRRDDDFLQMRIDFFKKMYEEMGCGEAGEKQVAYLQEAVIKNKSQRIEYDVNVITDAKWKDFEIVHVPGHCPDQIALYEKESQWLFAGDLLINHISTNAIVEPDPTGERNKSLVQHKQSLEKCLSLPLSKVFSGHGKIIEDAHSLLRQRIEGIDIKAAKFASLIQAGYTTANAIAQHYYKDPYEKQFSLVMSEVIGHLDYLEDKGKVSKEKIQGVWHYTVEEQVDDAFLVKETEKRSI